MTFEAESDVQCFLCARLQEDWYCAECKNDENEIVQPGAALKRKKKGTQAKHATGRDWGRGMATAGVSKKCTVAGIDHVGPIPGVEVGQSWILRLQVATDRPCCWQENDLENENQMRLV